MADMVDESGKRWEITHKHKIKRIDNWKKHMKNENYQSNMLLFS
jgi:hypothetical protein